MKRNIKKEDSVFGKDNSNEPIPLRPENNGKKKPLKNIKYPVIGISVALILGVFTFFNTNESPSTTENATTAEESLSIENINAEKIANIESMINIFQTDMGHTSNKLKGLSNQLSLYAKHEEVILRGEAADITENIKLIQSDIRRIDSAFVKVNKQLTKRAVVSRKKNINVVFNFDVDGLGSWGGKPFLSVGYQGKYQMMEIGETINGWKLMNLDLVSRVATFKHKTGRSVTRHV